MSARLTQLKKMALRSPDHCASVRTGVGELKGCWIQIFVMLANGELQPRKRFVFTLNGGPITAACWQRNYNGF